MQTALCNAMKNRWNSVGILSQSDKKELEEKVSAESRCPVCFCANQKHDIGCCLGLAPHMEKQEDGTFSLVGLSAEEIEQIRLALSK